MNPILCIFSACRQYALASIFGRCCCLSVSDWKDECTDTCPLVPCRSRNEQEAILAQDEWTNGYTRDGLSFPLIETTF